MSVGKSADRGKARFQALGKSLSANFEKCGKAGPQENRLKLFIKQPYRKPTQVDWWRTPRRTGENSLRNSAKKRP